MFKKYITINNDKDYRMLLNKLWLYKGLLYRFTTFKIKNNINNKDITYLEEALNIKNRKKRITYIFDTCCKILDDHTKGINICGFKDGKCYVQRQQKSSKCNGCCRICLYQTKNGCPSKNVACKLFNCSEVKSRTSMLEYKDLKLIKLLSWKNKLIIKSDYFSLREEALGDLYCYTATVSIIRIVYRLIRNYIKRKK